MTTPTRIATLLGSLLVLAGCAVDTAGTPGAVGDEPAASRSLTDGEPDPCGLLDAAQRRTLGVGSGEESESIPLKGARLCRWDGPGQVSGEDLFQGGVLPSAYRLSDVRTKYPSPQDATIDGRPALSTSMGVSLEDDSCVIFTELRDGRLAVMSYRWVGLSSTGPTRDASCRRSTDGLELIVRSVGSR